MKRAFLTAGNSPQNNRMKRVFQRLSSIDFSASFSDLMISILCKTDTQRMEMRRLQQKRRVLGARPLTGKAIKMRISALAQSAQRL